jgi:quercetin dioxygenase-like cupin family protein
MIEAGGGRTDGESIVSAMSTLTAVLIAGEHNGGRFALIETLEVRGSEPPSRVHTREDQAIYVLDGLIRFCVDGAWLRRPAGTCVLLPKGCEHAYSVESQQARLLVVAVPAGIEGCYRELDNPDGASRAAVPDFERLVTVSARYGVEIAVPEAGTGIEQREAKMEHE